MITADLLIQISKVESKLLYFLDFDMDNGKLTDPKIARNACH